MNWGSMTGDIAVLDVDGNTSMIPLQAVVMEGHDDVMRALVLACPNSLEGETNLAMNNYQFGAYQVLKEQNRKFLQERLFNILNREVNGGNTFLHNATANKFIGIVNMLLAAENSTSQVAIEVNSINIRGLTPLDQHYQNVSRDAAARKVSHILQNAAAHEGRHFLSSREIPLAVEPKATGTKLPQRSMQTLETKNLLLVFFVMVVGVAITIVCSPPSFNLKDNSTIVVFDAKSLIYGELPTIFYLMIFNTAGFILGMGPIVMLLWSFCFRIATLLAAVVIFIIYGLMLVENKELKFSVTFGHRSLSAAVLVWLSGTAFILSGTVVLAALNYIFFLLCCYKSAEKTQIETINQMEKQKSFDENNVNEIPRNFQPGTLTSSFAEKLMSHSMAPTHWGRSSPSANT